MSGDIGFLEAVSLAVGGMIGGGIFAVLGVVASTAGVGAWLSFVAAGVLALCAGYSFVRLRRVSGREGGPVAHIEAVSGKRWVAGMTGWVFTFGYVGTMAMYAYAFGSYALGLVGVRRVLGVAARPLVSVAAVAAFVGMNALGARVSGRAEDVLVAAKVAILLVVGVGGVWYGLQHDQLRTGFSALGGGVVTAAAVSFVAFEGWELLTFDTDAIRDADRVLPRAILSSIVVTTALYVLVAVVTTNLLSAATIRRHAEVALAYAAKPFLQETGFVLVSVAAVLSTASALNATLFSAARLSRQVATATHDDAADVSTESHRTPAADVDGPVRSLLVLGVLTAVLTAYGSLTSITSFASGAFITIFGGVSALAFTVREDVVTAAVPALGAVGSGVGLAGLLWHLHQTDPSVLVTVAVIYAVVLSVYWLPRRR